MKSYEVIIYVEDFITIPVTASNKDEAEKTALGVLSRDFKIEDHVSSSWAKEVAT